MSYFTKVENRSNVIYVIGDMYEPYLIVTKIMFKNAKYIVDKFHYIRYIMDALDDIRIRLQKSYGYNSKEYRMLKNKKNVSLLRKYSNDEDWWTYTKRYKNKHMVDILKYDLREELLKISKDLYNGYVLKELFLDFYNMLDENNLCGAKNILCKLRDIIGEDDPEYISCLVKLDLEFFLEDDNDKN